MPDQGPEPTGWELLRASKRIEDSIREMSGRFVSLELYAADRKADNEARQVLAGKLAKLEKEASDSAEAAKAAGQRAEEQKARNRQFLIGLIASPFVGAIVAYFVSGGLQP